MSRRVRDFRRAEPIRVLGREVVEGVFVDFRHAGAQQGADEKFPALDFGLDDDEAEVGFGVHVARHLLDEFDLPFDPIRGAIDETVSGPAEEGISTKKPFGERRTGVAQMPLAR